MCHLWSEQAEAAAARAALSDAESEFKSTAAQGAQSTEALALSGAAERDLLVERVSTAEGQRDAAQAQVREVQTINYTRN